MNPRKSTGNGWSARRVARWLIGAIAAGIIGVGVQVAINAALCGTSLGAMTGSCATAQAGPTAH